MKKIFFGTLLILNISSIFAQLNNDKKTNLHNYNSNIIYSEKQGNNLIESIIVKKSNDTITFWFDDSNSTKQIAIKNDLNKINNYQFHKYASKLNPTFKFHTLIEKKSKNIYLNKENNLATIKIYSDTLKNDCSEIIFVSDLKFIEKLLTED